VACRWRKESRNLAWLGLRDGMSVLDLGCGPGHFTERLAETLPNTAITALDVDPAMIEAARGRLAERFGGRMTFKQGPAEQTGLPDGSFDFAIARLLFQHLREPLLVAREAHRVLKQGGRLVVIDDDDDLFGVVEPAVPRLGQLLAKYGEAQARRGGNRRVGRWLTRLLRDAGFIDVDQESVAIHSDEAGLAECFPQLDARPLDWLAAAGYLTRAEQAEFQAARREFFGSAEPFAILLLFMASGTKPERDAARSAL
jgi:ubiquinone/menaquinone biosynthesis C-methylase UbiE